MTKPLAKIFSENPGTESSGMLELVCAADSLVELRAAVDNGADWIKLNYRADSGSFTGHGFENTGIRKGIRYAHDNRCKVLFALDCSPLRSSWRTRREIVDRAVLSGVDALALSDSALMLYVAAHYPDVQLHFAIEEAVLSCESVNFYRRQFGVTRVLLPRLLSLPMLERLGSNTEMELAVFGFGHLVTVPSRHGGSLSALRHAPSIFSAASTDLEMAADADPVRAAVERCAADESSSNDHCYNVSGTFDLNILRFLPQLSASGVRAIVAESPLHAPMHLAHVTRIWREAIDDCLENIEHYCVKPSWIADLSKAAKDMSRNECAHASM